VPYIESLLAAFAPIAHQNPSAGGIERLFRDAGGHAVTLRRSERI
jgi:hypothetical protein